MQNIDYSDLLHNQATSVLVLSSEFQVMYLNESAQSLLQVSTNRAEGQLLSNLIKDNDQILCACRKAVAGQGEIRLRNHSLMLPSIVREKVIDCIVTTVEKAGETLVILECHESKVLGKITQEENFIDRQRSNRELIRGMAHEIRNPLGGIRGAAQLMSEEAGEKFREYTRIIIQETDRLTDLVNRMQAESHVDLEQSINIHNVLEDVRQLVEAELNGELCIQQDYDPSLPLVKGNWDLLVQALFNVIRNAAESVATSPEISEIVLKTRIDRLSSDTIKKQVVRVEVTDNGPGVPTDLASRIFDPMITNKPSGSGLGLPITAEIIAQLKGTIDFKSRPGKTTFRMFIPVSDSGEQNR